MKSTEFKVWMRSIERMSRTQRDKLRKRLKGKEDADEVVVLIECSSVSGKILRQHFFSGFSWKNKTVSTTKYNIA